jgi:hypothetical protein
MVLKQMLHFLDLGQAKRTEPVDLRLALCDHFESVGRLSLAIYAVIWMARIPAIPPPDEVR